MTIRSRMSLIMDPIRPEQPGLFALELGKIAEFYIVYTLVLFTLQVLSNHHQTWSKSV